MSDSSSTELVTIVIPARNESCAIEAAVRSAQNQTYQNLQIIVVDGDSNDNTANIVKRLARDDSRVELLINTDRIIPVSLNMAAVAALGTWLVRLDAHAEIPSDFVEKAVKHLATGKWGGVGGRKNGVAKTVAGEAVAAAMSSRFGVGNSVYHYGTKPCEVDHIPFGSYPLDIVRELGGWNEQLRVNQDYEFDYRVRMSGRPLLFDPELVIRWESRQSVKELFSQYRRYGNGKAKVIGMHPDSLKPRHLAAPALVAALGAAGFMAPRHPRAAAAFVAPYAAVLATSTVVNAKKVSSPRAVAYLPAAFLAMHMGWGIGFFEGLPDLVAQLLATKSTNSDSRSPSLV